jgi:hypothetical protein
MADELGETVIIEVVDMSATVHFLPGEPLWSASAGYWKGAGYAADAR